MARAGGLGLGLGLGSWPEKNFNYFLYSVLNNE
jgi:hypothetical protein